MLEKAKLILGLQDNEKDSLLQLYLEMVNDELYEILGDVEVKDSLKIKMIVFKYNRQGTEVLSSYNYAGVSESFLNGYSQDIVDSINSYKRKNRKVRFI